MRTLVLVIATIMSALSTAYTAEFLRKVEVNSADIFNGTKALVQLCDDQIRSTRVTLIGMDKIRFDDQKKLVSGNCVLEDPTITFSSVRYFDKVRVTNPKVLERVIEGFEQCRGSACEGHTFSLKVSVSATYERAYGVSTSATIYAPGVNLPMGVYTKAVGEIDQPGINLESKKFSVVIENRLGDQTLKIKLIHQSEIFAEGELSREI